MADLSLFIPITKVDATQHLVYGVATAEVEDRAGEICDYASTKQHYERWSDEIAQSTGGKSLGNLRAMHGPVAAGKVTAITFNDEARQIEICAKVVDEAEWIKVTEGVYTGFSQGGTYERRWTDEAGLTRYTAVPSEISLVDLPCLPQARFEMIKADGTHELRGFEPRSSIVARLDGLAQNLGWLASLSPDDLHDLPGLAAEITELHALSARLATVLGSVESSGKDPHEHHPRGSRRAAASNDQDRTAPSARALRHVDQGYEDREDRRIRVRKDLDTPVRLDALPPATKAMQWDVEKRFDTLGALLADILQRVKNIEQQPLPLPLSGRHQVVAKHEDGDADRHHSAVIDTLLADPEALSILAIRLAQRNGRAPLR